MRVTIPAAPRGIGTVLGLRDWVGANAFPTDAYFESIDHARRCLTQLGDKDDPEAIVSVMAVILKKDESFIDYVLDECGQNVTKPEDWAAHFEAFAWYLVQRYFRDLSNDEWTFDG